MVPSSHHEPVRAAARCLASPVDRSFPVSIEVGGVDIDRLGDAIAAAAAHIDAATHRLLEMIRAFDSCEGYARHGAKSCAHWLSWRIGLLPGAARERVRVARALGELPVMDETLRRGEISYSKVRAMTRVATAENEARRSTGPGPDAHPGANPVADVSAGTDHDLGAGVREAQAQRGFGARQADALVNIADSFLARGSQHRNGAERTQLFVHLGPSRLDPESHLEATLQDGTSLSSAALLRLACDSGLVPIRTSNDGAGANVLDVGRRTRSVPVPIHRALQARDRGCRFPGCSQTVFVDAHHVKHWAQGGETKLSNLLNLCRLHHTAVHEGGFRVESEGESFTFYTPQGRILPRVPVAPEVPGKMLEALRARHAADGLHIHPEIQLGPFRLEAIEYDWAVEALLPRETKLAAA